MDRRQATTRNMQERDRLGRVREEVRHREGDAVHALGARRRARDHRARSTCPNLHTVELKPWPRRGGKGVFLNHDASRTSNDCYVCEIPPGKQLAPQRQLYEEMIYVLDGRGSTAVWNDAGQARELRVEGGRDLRHPAELPRTSTSTARARTRRASSRSPTRRSSSTRSATSTSSSTRSTTSRTASTASPTTSPTRASRRGCCSTPTSSPTRSTCR